MISVVIAAMVGAQESASVLVTGSIDCWLVVVMTYIMTTFTSGKQPVSGYMWCFLVIRARIFVTTVSPVF